MRRFLMIGVAGFTACALFYLAFLNYLEPTQAGISWNFRTGEVQLQDSGWHITPPWVMVARVDTRPVRVCVTSASRAFSCKLAQFVPHEYKLFAETEGVHYYWWYNRFSFNWGYDEEYRGMRDILRGYTYSSKQYSFVVVRREYAPNE